VKPVSNFFF